VERTTSLDDPDGRYHVNVSYRMGDVNAPFLARTEALLTECTAFGRSIRETTPVINDGMAGLRVVLMLEAASESLRRGGEFIDVQWSIVDQL